MAKIGARYIWDEKSKSYVEVATSANDNLQKSEASSSTKAQGTSGSSALSEWDDFIKKARARASANDLAKAQGKIGTYAGKVENAVYKPGAKSALGSTKTLLNTQLSDIREYRERLKGGKDELGIDDETINKLLSQSESDENAASQLYDVTRARTGDASVLKSASGDAYDEYARLLRLSGYDTLTGNLEKKLPEEMQTAGRKPVEIPEDYDFNTLGDDIYRARYGEEKDGTKLTEEQRQEYKQRIELVTGIGDFDALSTSEQLNLTYDEDYLSEIKLLHGGLNTYQDALDLASKYTDEDIANDMTVVQDYHAGHVNVPQDEYNRAHDRLSALGGADITALFNESLPADASYTAGDYTKYLQSYLKQMQGDAEQAQFDDQIQQKYGQYLHADDFKTNSQPMSIDANPTNEAEMIHEAIVAVDDVEVFDRLVRAYSENGMPPAAMQKYNGSTINADQRAMFNYLWNTHGQDAAMEYLDDIEWSVNKATAAKTEEVSEQLADSPLGAAAGSVASVLASPARAAVLPVNTARAAIGDDINQYDQSFNVGRAYDTVRSNVGADLDEALNDANILGWKIGSGVYNGVMSVADNLMLAGLGAGAGSAVMGLEAGDTAMRTALENGRSEWEAIRDAYVTAGIEAATEKLPMENLFGEVGSPAKYIITNALSEAGEEVTSELLNLIYDQAMYGEDSELGRLADELRVKGYAGEGLTEEVLKNIVGRVRDAAFSGIAGGAIGAAPRAAATAIENKSTGKNLQANNAAKSMLDLADVVLPEGKVKALAKEQRAALEDIAEEGKKPAKVSDAKIGRIYREVMKAVDEQAQSTVQTTAARYIDELLRARGVDDKELAQSISRIVADNGSATQEDHKAVASNDQALAVTEGLVKAYDTGMELVAQAEGIAEKAVKKADAESAQVVDTDEEKVEEAAEAEVPDEELDAAEANVDAEVAMQTVEEAAAEYGVNAKSVVDAYHEGQDPVVYTEQFKRAYQYGEAGYNFGVISKSQNLSSLNEQQVSIAYMLGKSAREGRNQQAAQQPKGSAKVGNVDSSQIRGMKLNETQGAAVDAISRLAKAVGFNVVFTARTFDEKGNATSKKNGSWQNSTRTLTIDINAGRITRDSANYAVMQTAGHELTHFIKKFADANLWNEYQDFVVGHMSEKMSEAELDYKIDKLIKRYAKQGQSLDRDGAMEEVIAEASGDVLLKLTDNDIQQMSEQNPKLLKKIGNFIQKWISEVKSLIEKAYAGQEVRNQFAEQMVDVVDELGAKWAELLKNAAQHARMADGKDVAVNAQDEVKLSLQENERLMQNAFDANAKGGFANKSDLKAAADARAEVAAFMRDDSRDLNLPEDLMGNTFFSDAAYGGSEENTTVCPRSIGADAFLDAVSDKIGRPLTVAEQVRISQDVIGAADIKEPQCIYCYVAADRAAYREFLGKYIDQRNGVINALKDGATDTAALYETFLNGRKDTPNMKKRFKLWVDSYRAGKRMLSASDLSNIGVLTSIQSDKYRQLSGDANFAAQMKDALAYAQSASWAKKRVNYVAYNGHILKWTQNRINKLNSMYGLRMYSFSDFSPAFALENMQMVTDAAVRGLKMLAYTKVPAFAEIFADTGMNINVSVFATEVKGDSGSSIVENNLMGADWKAAQKLRSKHENIGVTFVATSDAQVEWALAQEWIDVVIPYHLVRTGRTIAEMMKYKNYTAESGDTKKPNWSKGGNLSSIPAALHNNDRDTYMRLLEENNLEPRFARFVDNPNYMKLVNETRQSVTTSKPVQPIFNTDAAINALQDMANNGGYYVPVGGSEQRMYELADEFAGRVQAGEYKSDISETDDVKYSIADDEEYMQAYEDGDDYTARQIVKKAAAAAGYDLTPLYHGTGAFGFTKINPEKSDDGISFFVSDDDLVAETYVGENTPIRRIGSGNMDFDKLMAADGETLLSLLQKHVDGAYQLVSEDESIELAQDEGVLIRKRIIPKAAELKEDRAYLFENDAEYTAYDAVVDALERLSYAADYEQAEELYIAYDDALRELNKINPDVASAFRYNVGDDVYARYNWMQTYFSGDLFKIENDWDVEYTTRSNAIDMLVPKLFKGIYELYGRMDNLLEIDAGGLGWRHIDGSFIGRSGYVSTREVSAYAKANGYSGVYFRNIVDVGGMANYNAPSNVLTFFNPNDLKSADPYTYDDNGNLIPPSKRFNRDDDDIRYSFADDELTPSEYERFERKLGEIMEGKRAQFIRSTRGEYIFAIDRKLVYNNGDAESPRINVVLTIDLDDETDIDNVRRLIYNAEEGKYSHEQARRIFEDLFGQGVVRGYDSIVHRANARKNGRGKRAYGGTVYEGNRARAEESINDYQLQDPTQLSDRELLANVMDAAAENEAELDFVRRYRAKIEELNKKQADLDATNAAIVNARKEGKKSELGALRSKAEILGKQLDRMDGQLLKFEAGKPLQAVVKRERAKLRQKANERVQKRVAEVRQQEADRRDRIYARMDELRTEKNQKIAQLRKEKTEAVKNVRDEKNESFARQKYLAEVKASTDKLRELVTNPTNKAHVPQVLRRPIADFLDALNYASASQLDGKDATKADERIAEATARMHEALQKINNQQLGIDTTGAEYFSGYLDLPTGYIEEFDAIMGKVRAAVKAADGINATPINRMRSSDLHELAKQLRTLHSAINNMNRLIANAKYSSAIAASQDSIKDLDAVKAKKDQNDLFKKISDFIDWKNTVPYYAFKRFGKGGKAIFDALMDGWDKLAFNAEELVKFTGKTYKPEEVKAWEREIKTIKLSSGDSVRMSVSQLMSIYCLAKREQAVGHLMGGGIRIADIANKGKRISQGENYILYAEDIDTMHKALTERQRKVADALQNDMVTRGSAWGNEISMRRFGYEMFTEPNYFPIKSDQNNRAAKDEASHENSLLRLLNMSATKDTVKGANNAIVVESIFDVYTAHMSDMAKYNALGLQILDLMKWLNYVERTEENGKITTQSVQKSLELAYGTEARRYIMEFIRNLNGEVEGGREDGLLNKFTSNYKIAAVGANLRVGLLQITSMPRAAVAINPKYLAAGIAKWNARGGKTSEQAIDKVGIAKWKSMGFYDTNISRNMRQMIKHDEKAIDKVRNGSMKLAEWGDAWTMGVLYGAVESELMHEERSLHPGTEAWDKRVNERMREIIYQTQVVDSTMTRSHLMRQRGYISGALAFMSEPTLALNMLNDALFDVRANIRKGVKWHPATAKKVAKVFAVSSAVSVLAAVVEALFTAIRDDDEYEKFADKYLDALMGDYTDAESFGDYWSAFFGSAFGSKLNPVANVPIISDAVDAWKNGADEQMWMAFAGELGEGWRALMKVLNEGGDLADYYRAVYKLMGGASKAAGVPASNAMRDVVSLYNAAVAEPMGWRRLQTYTNSASEAAKSIYAALEAGDDALADYYRERASLYSTDAESIDNAVVKLVNDAYARGSIDRDTASQLMVDEGGKRPRQAEDKLLAADYLIETGRKYSDMKEDYISGALAEKQVREYLKRYDKLRDEAIDERIDMWNYEKDTGLSYDSMKQDFIDGEITEAQAKNYRMKYGGADADEADVTLGKWKYERDTGLVYSEMKLDYEGGVISESQLRSYLSKYGGKDEEQIEETVSNYDYYIATGRTTSAPKYWRIAYAFDSGTNYGAYIDEAFDKIMYGGEKKKTWKQARSQIATSLASYYKNQYLAAKGTAAGAAMLERILDLYEAIGYDREYERKYIEENWSAD